MADNNRLTLGVIRWSARKAYDDYQALVDYLDTTGYPEQGELEKSVFESFQQLAAETFEFTDRISTLLRKEEA